MGRKLLRLLNGLITFSVTICLLAAGAYAGYSLWDNQQIYDSAETVFSELKEIRAQINTPTLSAMEQMLEESRKAREEKAAERAAAEAAAIPATVMPEAEEAVTSTPVPASTTFTEDAVAESIVASSEAPAQMSAEELSPDVTNESSDEPVEEMMTIPTVALAEEATAEPTNQATEKITEEPKPEATEENAAVSAETLIEEPLPDITETPSAARFQELKEEPDSETTSEPTATPVPETTEESDVISTPEPTDEPTVTPVPETTEEPDVTSTPEPLDEPTATPVPETTEEPDVTPTSEPTDEQTATPVPETTEESDVTSTPEVTETPTAEPTTVPTAVPTEEPTPEPTPDNSPFGQLKQINEEITAWLTMPGTAIDYPVLQGRNNYSYINTDPYGNFALVGSIFLDSRNDAEYQDLYSLLYGHNMSQHRMFSDVNLYKEESFFRENRLGLMLLPDGYHILETVSVIVTPASNSAMFNPENWDYLDEEGILKTVQEDALYINEEGLEILRDKIEHDAQPRIVSLSTCSDEFTDARTILLTLMDPEIPTE